MYKILVVFTGGTIGSEVSDNIIDTDRSSSKVLLKTYKRRYHDEEDVEFEVIQPFTILSENISLEEYTKLNKTLFEINWDNYSGVIITHGTDTLPYTSALLGMLFGWVKIPIVIVSSNYVLSDYRSNGVFNFASAVDIIKSNIRGVFVPYRDEKDSDKVYLATRIQEIDNVKDQMVGYGDNGLGYWYGSYLKSDQVELMEQLQNYTQPFVYHKPITFKNDVLLIKSYPGCNFSHYCIDKNKPSAVLLYLYHSGTGCVSDNFYYSAAQFCKKCEEESIPVYISSFKALDKELYTTSRTLIENGAIPLKLMSMEATYIKLLIAYNQKEVEPEVYMSENIYFESLAE